jgi:hypothetical protein
MNHQAVIDAAHRLVDTNPNWTLVSLIATLDGLHGRAVYERVWRDLAGTVPSYRDEQAVVQALIWHHLYGDRVTS